MDCKMAKFRVKEDIQNHNDQILVELVLVRKFLGYFPSCKTGSTILIPKCIFYLYHINTRQPRIKQSDQAIG